MPASKSLCALRACWPRWKATLPLIILADENGKSAERTRNAGRVTPEMGLSDTEWQIFAEGATKVAEAVKREAGLRTAFHHHCAGYVETPAEIERLMSLTDPRLLGLVFDCGHYRFGGGDPEEGLRKYGSESGTSTSRIITRRWVSRRPKKDGTTSKR